MIFITLPFTQVSFSFFQFSRFFITPQNANDANVAPSVPSSGGEETSKAANSNAASDNWATNIYIDCGVPSRSVAEYKNRYENTLDARGSGAMFSEGANSFMFKRQNVRRNMHIDD